MLPPAQDPHDFPQFLPQAFPGRVILIPAHNGAMRQFLFSALIMLAHSIHPLFNPRGMPVSVSRRRKQRLSSSHAVSTPGNDFDPLTIIASLEIRPL